MKNLEIKNNDSITPCGNQSGRSMIEMLGVLAIIGVLSVGGIAGYSKAMMKYRINKTIEQITLIAGNVRTFFANQPEGNGGYTGKYVGLDNTVIKKAKLVPDEMWDENKTKLINPFGGDFELFTHYGFSNDFAIFLSGIPQEVCIELVSQDWNASSPHAIVVGKNVNNALGYGLKINHNNCSSGTQQLSGGPFSGESSVPYVYCGTSIPVDTAISVCEDKKEIALIFH